jgi:probable HAF family extracellular repeat protein
MHSTSRHLLALAGASLMLTAHAATPRFHVTDLGPHDGTNGIAYGLAADGSAVGSTDTGAAIFAHGAVQALDTTDGASIARKVNAAGVAVGVLQATPDSPLQAVLWKGGTQVMLGALGGTRSSAMDINDAGQVVGYASTASDEVHPFLYQGGTMTDLGLPKKSTYGHAQAVNAMGQIAGFAYFADGSHVILRKNGKWVDLGMNGAKDAFAYAINAKGWIAGYQVDDDAWTVTHAFVWKAGAFTVLSGFDAMKGWCINRKGHVVGTYLPDDSEAFYYDGTQAWDIGTHLDKASAGWQVVGAYAIDDADRIAGQAIAPDGTWHAVILSRVSSK